MNSLREFIKTSLFNHVSEPAAAAEPQ